MYMGFIFVFHNISESTKMETSTVKQWINKSVVFRYLPNNMG